MSKISPVKASVLIRVFELDGWELRDNKSGHATLVKPGFPRPIVIPVHSKPCATRVIRSNMRTAKMSRERYFKLLKQAK